MCALAALFIIAKTTQGPFGGWMDEKMVAYPYHGTLLNRKRTNPLIHTTTWMNLKSILLNKGNQSWKPI